MTVVVCSQSSGRFSKPMQLGGLEHRPDTLAEHGGLAYKEHPPCLVEI